MSIEQQLTAMGLQVSSTLISDDFNGMEGSHTHKAKLSNGDVTVSMNFTAGCAHRTPMPKFKSGGYTIHEVATNMATKPNPPSLEDVVYALMMDSQCVMHGQSFDEFCEDLGYDNDSRAAKKTYNGCVKQWRKMVKLGLYLEELEEIFQDF